METPAVLFLIFNRPDTTERVFERIRAAQPKQLFVAADGPRVDREGEAEQCAAARHIVDSGIDWPCDVHKLYRDENLGCREAVSGAITWFFEHVEEGIILEDDCLPDMTFFPFCAELLERYRHDTRVMSVSGENPFEPKSERRDSYFFVNQPFIWGWATWRRAWSLYRDDLTTIAPSDALPWLVSYFGREEVGVYHHTNLHSMIANQIDSWGYPWSFSCIFNSGLCACSASNLVQNIGFDNRGTHTTQIDSADANRKLVPQRFPLIHPPLVIRDFAAEEKIGLIKFRVPHWDRTWENLGKRIDTLRRRVKKRLIQTRPRRLTSFVAKFI